MKRVLRWGAGVALVVMAVGCGRNEGPVAPDRALQAAGDVVVWVDGVGITQGQVQREVARLMSAIPQGALSEKVGPNHARILQQAVDALINRALVRAELERSGMLISQAEVNASKEAIERNLDEGFTLGLMLASLKHTMEELEESLRLEIFINNVLKNRIDAAIDQVGEELVRTYYDEHPAAFTSSAARQVSHILIRFPRDASDAQKAEIRARAEGIRQAILEGEDFAVLAREISECSSASRSGYLGLVSQHRNAPEFEDAVYSLEIGAPAEVVESPVGVHVVKVTGERPATLAPFEEVHDRIRSMLRDRAKERVSNDHLAELRQRSTIKVVGGLADVVEVK